MFGLMGPQRVRAASSHAADLDAMLKAGVKQQPDIGALASRGERMATVMVWRYHDDDLPGPVANIQFSLRGMLPSTARVLVHHYRIDATHSNSYTAWKQMGSPQKPTPEQYALLEAAGQLELIESPFSWIRYKERRLLRLDPLCCRRHWKLDRGMVFQQAHHPRTSCQLRAQGCFGFKRRSDAGDHLCAVFSREFRAGHFQPGVLRATILVNAGDDPACGHFPSTRRRVGSGTGRIRRRHGRGNFRLGGRLDARSRKRLHPVFLMVSMFHVLAFGIILASIRRVEPVTI